MERFQIKRSTVIQHLFNYFREGHPIRESEELLSFSTVSPETREAILNRFETFGIERLKPVFEALDGKVDYEELRILQLYYMGQVSQ